MDYPTAHDILVTWLRWGLGVAAGTALALVWISISLNRLRFAAEPALNFGRALPILGILPFVQWQFGVSEIGKVLLVAWATSFPIWIATRDGLRDANEDLGRVVRLTGAPLVLRLRYLHVPLLMRALISGITISVGFAWLVVMAAETIGSYSRGFFSGGIGVRLYYAVNDGRYTDAAVCLAVFGLSGIASTWVWSRLMLPLIAGATRVRPLAVGTVR